MSLYLIAITLAALSAALPGCQAAKPQALVDAPDPCDPNHDTERCEPTVEGIRQVCSATSKQWLTVAYCPSGHCSEKGDGDTATADNPSGIVAVCTPKTVGTGGGDATGGGYWQGGSTGSSGDTSDGNSSETSQDSGSLLPCGDGLCSADEGPDTCPADCAAVCGDGLCSKGEDGSSCAWDCVAGAQAGALCMIAKCPGGSLQCKAGSACELVLAQVWACAKGCSGCLSTCLSQVGADPIVFSVASCSAAACVGTN